MGMVPFLRSRLWLLRMLADTRGQDMIEYALMAAMVAIAAGAILQPVSPSMSVIYSKMVDLFAKSPS
ncbi:MAG: hypothetical protein NTY38_07285 [Acidobacteria bacterium]|nr:hypothetical protein [Acidobacteriota bacterium]